ncbi:hypothetical protein EK21DRAFT_100357 [Setomelanomma holmii]|uniref:Geranylgeranyl pyrophosphate synthetase n=1 Tax=Setomelanomma holmii TaxID=210430 RepID=A0A9P4HAF6_9PLEO|nr:hypothetical protein EK21DRAFT_100357 [Setomelanomma holmii]
MSSMPSFRGGHAPRRGRGGWTKPFAKSKRDSVKPDIDKHPLGKLLKTFKLSDLHFTAGASVGPAITDLQYVTSYNWRNNTSHAILVPGKPPRWTPLQKAQRLKEDSGLYYRDPNAARYTEYPIAPVVQAILDTKTSCIPEEVDVLACGSTLGNLLRFARGQDKAFRFAVEKIGNTVFLIRKENDSKEIIENVRGFGHSFPEAYTTWEKEVKGSETHQRVVQYDFGGFTCLVRFECDGYLKDLSKSNGSTVNSSVDPSLRPSADGEDLLAAFGKASIAQKHANECPISSGVTIEHGGAAIDQSAIFDLKTRSGKYKANIDMSDIYPQLWLKQIPNFIVAFHDGAGLFEDIRVQDVRNDTQKWEQDNLDAILRLKVLLKEIVASARDDAGLLEVYCPGSTHLEIRKQYGQGQPSLPANLRDKWTSSSEKDSFSDLDEGGLALNSHSDVENDPWGADSEDEEPDYTACSAEDCGYCGKCTY